MIELESRLPNLDIALLCDCEEPELLSYRRAEPSSKGEQRQFPSTTPELRPRFPALVVMLDQYLRFIPCKELLN